MPALLGILIALGPRLFNNNNFQIGGEVAVVDLSGRVMPELRSLLDPAVLTARVARDTQDLLARAPESVRKLAAAAPAPVPDLRLIERPATADAQAEKAWLNAGAANAPRRLALIVIHEDAATVEGAQSNNSPYDMYVPSKLDDRASSEIQRDIRDAIVNARLKQSGFARQDYDAIGRVRAPRSITVMKSQEQESTQAFNILLPMAFGLMLFLGAMTGGGSLLTSTVEEKSSRVMEVLLSAVSPVELMAGKLFGQLAVGMTAMSLYIALGLVGLASFSLFGMLNPWLIVYLGIFYFLTYFVYGSLMMAIGSSVNEMSEAQSLMMPIMLLMMIPWMLWLPISRDPNSAIATALSFVPLVSGFAMMLRMASLTPPPLWQVWLSILVGVATSCAAVWFAAKVFRIGMLMHGKAPNLATLIRWARAA